MDELELRLAARRTVGLEAELRHRAEEVAGALQEALLPAELPEIPGLDVVARYHVAYRDQVGGDFYDLIPDDAGGCGVVVGDACGKGTLAASLTGVARWALRTVAVDTWTPASALTRLNQVLVRGHGDPERYCTLALAALRPQPGGGVDLTVALAGHPHPLVIRTDGRVERLGRTSPVVGWMIDAEFTEVPERLETGDVLVMFTDGMLEAVAGHGSSDDARLHALLGPFAGSTAADVAEVLDDALGGEELRDDAAFLVIRST
jgi:serine phosphatase RsbU (regulator of sigma subunit)